MNTYSLSLLTSDFILGDDGIYVGTILASTHGLGQSVYVQKALQRNSDVTFDNIILSYRVELNGDVKIYMDEPAVLRIVIAAN